MPRADLALTILTISMRAPRVNATRTAGQALSVAQLEKSLLARYSSELHLIYYRTCKHLFANHFIESALQLAGERSSESCHKLALAIPSLLMSYTQETSPSPGGTAPQSSSPKACQILGMVAGECWGRWDTWDRSYLSSAGTYFPAVISSAGRQHQHRFTSSHIFREKTHAAPSSGGTGVPPSEGPGGVLLAPQVRCLVYVPGAVLGGMAVMSSSSGCGPLIGGSSRCHVHMNNRKRYWVFAPFLCSYCRLAHNALKTQ